MTLPCAIHTCSSHVTTSRSHRHARPYLCRLKGPCMPTLPVTITPPPRLQPCSESPAALAKNDTIRLTLEQPPWSPALHQCFPRKFRDAARLLLMASTCATTTTTTCCGLQEGLDSRDGDVYGPALSLPAPGGAAADGGFNDGCMKGEGGEVPRNDCSFSDMPRDVVLLVVGHMAYPISAWVDPSQYRDPGDEDV